MSEERKENQSVQTVSVTKSSVDAADTNTKNEDVKILGIVESCGHLRIRKEPNKESDVVATIPVGTMVELVNDEVIDGLGDRYSEVQGIVNGEAEKKYYTIQSGDVLSKIAAANGTTVDNLVRLNGIGNPNLIYAGTYKFLQIKYTLTKDGKVIKRINPKRVTTMRRKLKKLSLKVINGEIEYESIENMFRGWMGAHYKLLSKQQRKNLIQLYEELFNKKISVISRKLIVSDASSLAA